MKRRQYNDIKDNACEFLTKSASNDNGKLKQNVNITLISKIFCLTNERE